MAHALFPAACPSCQTGSAKLKKPPPPKSHYGPNSTWSLAYNLLVCFLHRGETRNYLRSFGLPNNKTPKIGRCGT